MDKKEMFSLFTWKSISAQFRAWKMDQLKMNPFL